jgi:MoxR-like ATPase
MLRLRIGYPNLSDEIRILRDRERREPLDFIQAVMSESDILEIQDLVTEVRMDDALIDYLMQIVSLTREGEHFELGVSPRGSLALFRAAQALALVEGREFCLPDDIKRLVVPTFAHRVVVNSRYAASLNSTQQTEKALQDVLNKVRVPV